MQAPTGSTSSSSDHTETFVLDPASLAICLSLTVPSEISGIASLKKALRENGCYFNFSNRK